MGDVNNTLAKPLAHPAGRLAAVERDLLELRRLTNQEIARLSAANIELAGQLGACVNFINQLGASHPDIVEKMMRDSLARRNVVIVGLH